MYVLSADKIFDGKRNKLINNGVITIKDEVIVDVGKKENIHIPRDAEIINLPEHTLLPGMIDAHSHLSLSVELEDYLLKVKTSTEELIKRAVDNMTENLNRGITTLRCPGEKSFIDAVCKDIVKQIPGVGPSLYTAGKGVRSSEGHGFIGYAVDNINEIKKYYRENKERGAEFFKFYLTSNLPKNGRIAYYYSREKIKKIISTAHSLDRKIAAHAVGGEGLRIALEAGLDMVEHGYFMDQEMMELISANDKWLVVTNTFLFNDTVNEHLHDREFAEKIRRYRDDVRQRFEIIFDSDINLALGTDGYHGALYQEIKLAVKMGLSEYRALKMVTADSARLLNREDELGSIQAGKKADIIAVPGNPFNNIDVLSEVNFVMKGGEIIKEREC